MIDDYLFKSDVKKEENIIATYFVRSKDLMKAAKAIAIGQSIGNPEVRTERDSPQIFERNLSKIVELDNPSKDEGIVRIAYPLVNFDCYEDGLTQLLCTLMGGQMDIDFIEGCRLLDVEFPKEYLKQFKGPKFGLKNIKKRAKAIDRPLLGGIVKPKTGMNVSELEGLVKEMLEGGVDFIKEDEILGNPKFCSFKDRVERVANLVNEYGAKQGREIFYAPCINSDPPYFLQRAIFASDVGAKAVHLNVWAGAAAYKALRELELDSAIFYQKSGDKVITSQKNPNGIEWSVMCKLARMSGADFIHAGMWGGYLSDSFRELSSVMDSLKGGNQYLQTVPSLSCGSHPGLVDTTVKYFGKDLMMNAGGSIQGHPMGTTAGAIAMRQAFLCNQLGEDIYSFINDKPELKAAIDKWGYTHY